MLELETHTYWNETGAWKPTGLQENTATKAGYLSTVLIFMSKDTDVCHLRSVEGDKGWFLRSQADIARGTQGRYQEKVGRQQQGASQACF